MQCTTSRNSFFWCWCPLHWDSRNHWFANIPKFFWSSRGRSSGSSGRPCVPWSETEGRENWICVFLFTTWSSHGSCCKFLYLIKQNAFRQLKNDYIIPWFDELWWLMFPGHLPLVDQNDFAVMQCKLSVKLKATLHIKKWPLFETWTMNFSVGVNSQGNLALTVKQLSR